MYLQCKMDGDLKKIRLVGQYMIEIWKAIGMNMQNVRFLWASDEVSLVHPDLTWLVAESKPWLYISFPLRSIDDMVGLISLLLSYETRMNVLYVCMYL